MVCEGADVLSFKSALCDCGSCSYGVLKILPASFILEWEKAFHSLKPSLVFQNALSENDKAAVVPAVVLISVFILCIIVYIQCYFFF
jgi:hypothetical protein